VFQVHKSVHADKFIAVCSDSRLVASYNAVVVVVVVVTVVLVVVVVVVVVV